MKTGLIDLVNSKVGGSLGGGGRRTDNQVNYYAQRQLTTDDWNKLMDKNVSVQLKFLTVVNRMESIGCVFSSEHTMTHIVGLITLASSPPGARDIGVLLQNAWQMLQDVKLAFRRTRTRVRLPHHGAIAEYPSNTDSMSTSHVDMYKRAYSSEGPAPCRVDETLLCELRTHHTVATPIKTSCRGPRSMPEIHGPEPPAAAGAAAATAACEPAPAAGSGGAIEKGKSVDDIIDGLAKHVKKKVPELARRKPAAAQAKPAPKKETSTPMKKIKKKAASSAKSKKAAAIDTKQLQKHLKQFPFPGIPKAPMEPVRAGNYAIYTDRTKRAWRVKENNVRTDKAFGWGVDCEGSWRRAIHYIFA
ncbi:unnamed protein product [Prorocentrum cordatum]|uniref:AP2/ERF domain-containing protein n=1 Tax=Prorocentrum cordatum TaxID=2364126 RepID=A0ABN9XY00_9DINO|nr:unnamed protein product [Polarella glacialis]